MRKPDDVSATGGRDADALTSARRLRVITPSDGDAPPIDENDGDYNVKILRPMFGYLRNKLGADVLADVVHDCGLPPEVLERQTGWISHERLEHFLAATRELAGSDEEFMRACAYELRKQYGAFTLILRATSVAATYRLLVRTSHLVCRVGSFSTHSKGRNSIHVVYETERSESRLSCLSRQAQLTFFPTIFLGGAPAKLHEHSCVALGDKRCDYELSWNEHLRLRRVGAGLVLGGLVAALALPEMIGSPHLSIAIFAALGGTLGVAWELRRLVVEQQRFAADTTLEMEKIIVAHAQATDDLTELRERERDWNRQIEEGVAARTRKLNEVIERLQAVLRQRSPGQGAGQGADQGEAGLPNERASLHAADASGRSMETAVERVSKLVNELVHIAGEDAPQREMKQEPVSVDAMVVQIRRQLKAMMTGRNVRITVFQTREAPATIHTVRPLIERVIDNLLFNASRHTDRGSVVVEAGGTPGSLLLKVSDTGTGLSKERLEEVFETPKGSSKAVSNDRSSLAYAAGLLDQINGRLEIMSEPGVGTTVWLYMPVEGMVDAEPGASQSGGKALAAASGDSQTVEAEQSVVGRVVRIRSKLHPVAEP
jgi:signal transduction histidine kinase